MQKKTIFLTRRYILFVISVFINAYGIAFITKALLGTSPITSVNYVLSMFTPLTMGQWTIIVNLLFVATEPLMMSRSQLRADLRMYLIQIPVTLCFGTFIDISMASLSWLQPEAYPMQLLSMLAGCVILACGITLEVKADVAMVAGEFFVRVLARRIGGDFGYVKLGFDVGNVILACAFSMIFIGGIHGVREGTVAAALLVGPIVHFLTPFCRVLNGVLGYSAKTEGRAAAAPANVVVTIAREFIKMAAKSSGIDEDYIRRNEQTIPSFWLKCILSQGYGTQAGRGLSDDDVLFLAESKIVQQLADKEACVIVGRCADFVLKGRRGVVRVYCYADRDTAITRCTSEYGMSRDKAEAETRRINRARATHYEYYTGQRWDDPRNYDLMINTGSMTLEQACDIIVRMYANAKAGMKAADTEAVGD